MVHLRLLRRLHHGNGKGKKKEKKNKVDDEDDLQRKYRDFCNQVLYYNQGGEHFISTGQMNGKSLIQIFVTENNLNKSQQAIVQRIDKEVRMSCS